MRISKIVIDRDLCIGGIGAASCVTILPGVFQLDEENKAVLVAGSEPQWDDVETVIMAAKPCPTKAIFVYDENGEQIYPEP